MRVTFLLVAFLAGAHSFKAVERRAKPMGKGGGGVVARSVVEAAIQDLPAALREIARLRAALDAAAATPAATPLATPAPEPVDAAPAADAPDDDLPPAANCAACRGKHCRHTCGRQTRMDGAY